MLIFSGEASRARGASRITTGLGIIVMKAIHRKFSMPAAILAATVLVGGNGAAAQTAAPIPPSITTPDKVESRLGALDFKDGAPSKATLEKAYDQITSRSLTMRSSTQCRASAWSPHAEALSKPASRTTKSSSSPS